MYLQTIRTKDGKQSFHGTVIGWVEGTDEFWFVPVGGNKLEPWWAKLDYWDFIQGNVPMGKINIDNS